MPVGRVCAGPTDSRDRHVPGVDHVRVHCGHGGVFRLAHHCHCAAWRLRCCLPWMLRVPRPGLREMRMPAMRPRIPAGTVGRHPLAHVSLLLAGVDRDHCVRHGHHGRHDLRDRLHGLHHFRGWVPHCEVPSPWVMRAPRRPAYRSARVRCVHRLQGVRHLGRDGCHGRCGQCVDPGLGVAAALGVARRILRCPDWRLAYCPHQRPWACLLR